MLQAEIADYLKYDIALTKCVEMEVTYAMFPEVGTLLGSRFYTNFPRFLFTRCLRSTCCLRQGAEPFTSYLAALTAFFLADTAIFFGFTSADLGRVTSRTPSSKLASILLASTVDGRGIER